MDFLQSFEPLYAVSGFLVGGLVGMTGVGGGALMTPILVLLFGVHPATAVGTDLLYASATKTGGAIVHGWRGTIDWKVVGLLAAGSVPMTALTILTLYELDIGSHATQAIITNVLGVALFFTALALYFRVPLLRYHAAHVGEFNPRWVGGLTVFTGAVLGVLVTLSSVGAGAIGVTALLLLYPHMPTRRIVGSDITHAVPLTLVAGLGHWALGSIDWILLGSLLVGSLPGIVAGSLFATRISDGVLRTVLATVLLIIVAKIWFL